MTYNVFGGTLNPTLLLLKYTTIHLPITVTFLMCLLQYLSYNSTHAVPLVTSVLT